MTSRKTAADAPNRGKSLVALIAVLLAFTASPIGLAGSSKAQNAPAAATPADLDPRLVALGKSVWKEKVECNLCHGWAGNGVPDDPRMPVGANLRETKLTHDQIVEVVKCGRPGTGMPHFDAQAYTDTRCYGVTAEQLGKQTPDASGTSLIPREVDAVTQYIEANIKGKGAFTQADCIAFYGSATAYCQTVGQGRGDAPAPNPGGAAAHGG